MDRDDPIPGCAWMRSTCRGTWPSRSANEPNCRAVLAGLRLEACPELRVVEIVKSATGVAQDDDLAGTQDM